MKRGLVAFAAGMAVAGAAQAGPLRNSLFIADALPPASPTLGFTLVQDSLFDPAPVHHSGLVTRTDIAPNATLGLGLIKSSPKSPSGEWNRDGAHRSRKGLISFLLKF